MAGIGDSSGPKVTSGGDLGGSKETSNISTVQNLNFHTAKIDVVKFDGVSTLGCGVVRFATHSLCKG